MTKRKTSERKTGELSYDLETMTPAEEQQFWYEFEAMLFRARDTGYLPLSRVNIVNAPAGNTISDGEVTLH